MLLNMKYRPESIVRGWSPRRWPSGSWWLCRWSSPPSVCCRWPPPAWQLWSRYGGQWECFHGPCSEHDGHSHRFLIGPEPARAMENKDNTVRAAIKRFMSSGWLRPFVCVYLNTGRTALDCSAQHDPCVLWLLQLNSYLPQTHWLWHILQSCGDM